MSGDSRTLAKGKLGRSFRDEPSLGGICERKIPLEKDSRVDDEGPITIIQVNEARPTQSHFDLRTGRETAITGAIVSASDRAACSALNRQRAKGIEEATRRAPSRESAPADVWAALVAARAREWAVPLISLGLLGLSRDRDGMLASRELAPLKTGAEACPFADHDWGVVYKLFPLFSSGGLGKTVDIEADEDTRGFTMSVRDALVMETIAKLMVMHDAGGHATEIVGIDDGGEYLIAKQPLASPFVDLESDRSAAVARMRGVSCRACFKRPVWVLWTWDLPWVMSDLHGGNVMREASGDPCIIDALLSPLAPQWIKGNRELAEAVDDARQFRNSGVLPVRKAFDDVRDDEL